MLDRVYVRSHTGFGAEPLDVGALAEACVFYGSTQLVLGRGSLRQLLTRYGADSLVEFVGQGYVQAYMLDEDVGVHTEDTNGPSERHLPISFRIGSSVEGEVVEMFRESTGTSGRGRRRAKAFLNAVEPISLGPAWRESMLAAFRDPVLIRAAVATTAAHSLPMPPTDNVSVQDVIETADGRFQLLLSEEWPKLRRAYLAQRGDELNTGSLLVFLVESLTDLQLASRLGAEISTGELGSALLQIKCRELYAARSQNASNVADFQSHVLNGRDIRTAMNTQLRSLDDLMRLLDRAKKFRHWIDQKPIETDLVSAYIEEATAETWAAGLAAKTIRLATLFGSGELLLDAKLGLALGAADMFLVERLGQGWKPNQFIERKLDPFVRRAT